jgi:hypothetical protein
MVGGTLLAVQQPASAVEHWAVARVVKIEIENMALGRGDSA